MKSNKLFFRIISYEKYSHNLNQIFFILLFIAFWEAQKTCRHTSDSRRICVSQKPFELECLELSEEIM